MLIAQITDTHITLPGKLAYGAVDTGAALARAVAALGRLHPAPDITVVTGDLVDAGEPGDSRNLRVPLAPMDRMGLRGSGDFAEIIRRHPQVERICCGHVHRAIERRFAGTIAGTAPSTAHQAKLDLRPDEPLGFTLEPPGYQLHLWGEEPGLVTHTAVTGEWPQLYRASQGQLRIA